jgi:hypothetical protein
MTANIALIVGLELLCLLIPIPHHSIAVVLYLGCLYRIHLRKRIPQHWW